PPYRSCYCRGRAAAGSKETEFRGAFVGTRMDRHDSRTISEAVAGVNKFAAMPNRVGCGEVHQSQTRDSTCRGTHGAAILLWLTEVKPLPMRPGNGVVA